MRDSGYRGTGIGLFRRLGLVGVLGLWLLLHRRCGKLGGLLLRLGSLRGRLSSGTRDLTIRGRTDRSLRRRSVLWTCRELLLRLLGRLRGLLHRLLWGLLRLLLWRSQSRTRHPHRRLATHRRRISSEHTGSLVRTRTGSEVATLLLRRRELVIRRHSHHRRRGLLLLLLELPRRGLWWRIRTRALLLHTHTFISFHSSPIPILLIITPKIAGSSNCGGGISGFFCAGSSILKSLTSLPRNTMYS